MPQYELCPQLLWFSLFMFFADQEEEEVDDSPLEKLKNFKT